MVLGKLPGPGCATNLDNRGQGPTALAVGRDGVVWTFFSQLSFLFSFSLPLGDVDWLVVWGLTAL